MTDQKNRTELDASSRIIQAKTGAHAEATDTYMLKLRAELYGWIAQIDAEMARRNTLSRASDPEGDSDYFDDCSDYEEEFYYGRP